jgi:putative heme iron utilization protein
MINTNDFNFTSAQYVSGTDMDGNPVTNTTVIAVNADGSQSIIPANVGNEKYDHLLARHNDSDDDFTIADAD